VPLALELAAARVPLLGLDGVRERLNQRFALLTRAVRDAAERHRTLAATLDWTCALLSAGELGALQQLAVFSSSFSPAAAEAVLTEAVLAAPGQGDDALDLLDTLRERSLVVAEAGPTGVRLRLYDSVRRHALARLAREGQETEARLRHLRWMLARFEQVEADEFFKSQLSWLPAARLDQDSLRGALRFGLDPAAAPQPQDLALRLLAASLPFWHRSGQRAEGLRWLHTARALPARGDTAVLLGHAIGVFGLYAPSASPVEALAALRSSRPALPQAQRTRRLYLSLYAERMLLLRLDPRSDVGALLAQMQALEDPVWSTVARRHLGVLRVLELRDLGQHEASLARAIAVLEGLRQAGARVECWPIENLVAQALVLVGRLDEACTRLQRAADDIRLAGLQREQVSLLAVTASLLLRRDGRHEALALAREVVALLQAEDMLWWMADALPWAAWHAGRPGDAVQLQAWADALAQARGDSRGTVFTRLRVDFNQALAAHADAAALRSPREDGALPDDAAAVALAFGTVG
jgi:predicted ATPase